jgi:hypothetical protein
MPKIETEKISNEINISENTLKYFVDEMFRLGTFYLYMQHLGLVKEKQTGWAVVKHNDEQLHTFRKQYIFNTPYEEVDSLINSSSMPFHIFRLIEKEAERNIGSYMFGKSKEIKIDLT